MDAIAIPFDLLILDESIENMVAKGFPHQFALLSQLNGLQETSRQTTYPSFLSFLLGHVINIRLHWFRCFQSLLNSCQSSSQHHAKAKVGVAGRVRRTQLESCCLFFAW